MLLLEIYTEKIYTEIDKFHQFAIDQLTPVQKASEDIWEKAEEMSDDGSDNELPYEVRESFRIITACMHITYYNKRMVGCKEELLRGFVCSVDNWITRSEYEPENNSYRMKLVLTLYEQAKTLIEELDSYLKPK